ncbi:bifunctional riboflavin kinase/FAD synthetase [Metabacillus idriensis]|uniref:bifunctional riboflavin kinase/FAD synthetase n=1 Tax=Metabacillus idriensis TaxID=324768 RepID=UPI0028148A61|nr:bifunctional riboflavin kinase/FAD synthetase [Metabacillus idriensis]MDR0137410.1 bifunctional riboflavin kinase/FAD synthetase [Metabacillus idriensis]
MKTIKLTHPHSLNDIEMPQLAMALGYFDGVHRGHQEVILTAKKTAEEKGLKSAVMTFDPHPSVVLRKNIQHVEAITTLQDKIDLIERLEIDYLFVVQFSEEFAALLPQEFVDQYIIRLNVKHVIAGFDYSYGRLGKGTMETLPFHSRSAFEQTTISKQTDHDRKISSTLIREVLKNGDVEYASRLLNRPHKVNGTVIHGDKRGRTIGFPTANIELDGAYIIPPTGVYAVRFQIGEEMYNGVCNIGYKPTFYDEKKLKPSIEVHIFEFNNSIYGKNVSIFWYKRIRSEQKFGSIDELIQQIGKDKASAEQFFQDLQD